MDTLYFYIQPESIHQTTFTLDKDESHHFSRVLRKPVGTEIILINGKGTAYKAQVDSIDGRHVSGNILEEYPGYGENKINIHLALGILKGDRLKLAIEKATEMGVTSISLLTLDQCIKRDVKLDRLKKIVVSAVKQCGRSVIPEIKTIKSVEEWIKVTKDETRYVCALEDAKTLSSVVGEKISKMKDINVVIGPEGDFSTREISILNEHQCQFITLGSRRLRSETAVASVLAVINELSGY